MHIGLAIQVQLFSHFPVRYADTCEPFDQLDLIDEHNHPHQTHKLDNDGEIQHLWAHLGYFLVDIPK